MKKSVRSLMGLVVALLGLSVFPGTAVCQQKSLKDTIVGSWIITSVIDRYENGKEKNPWGTGVKGTIVFDGTGRFIQLIIGEAQPAMKTPEPRKPDALTVAYYGSYTLNEGDKSIAMKVEGATYSDRAGTQQSNTVTMKGDTMTLVGSSRKDQEGTFSPRLELKRAK
jgi:hypothetical protein